MKTLAAWALALLLTVAVWLGLSAWDQTCLGIFQDRFVCEAAREHRRDFRVCAEQSWTACEQFNTGLAVAQYEQCLDRVRCDCLERSGNEACDVSEPED